MSNEDDFFDILCALDEAEGRPNLAILAPDSYRWRTVARQLLNCVPQGTKILSTAREGLERHAHWYATDRKLVALKITPQWKRKGQQAETAAITRICEMAHALVIFHHCDERSLHIARIAQELGTPTFVFGPYAKKEQNSEIFQRARQHQIKQPAKTQARPPQRFRSKAPPAR